MATNVRAKELNYDRYSMRKYDRDIRNSIPGHAELHEKIRVLVAKKFRGKKTKILELGVGTGLTAETILREAPAADYEANDFSTNMLKGARIRLAKYPSVRLVKGDYAKMRFRPNNDAVVCVIGLHHQKTDADKKKLFKRIHGALRRGGVFVFGDLVTYRDREEAALNDALHYHSLVEHATDGKTLREWAFHHKFLNSPAPLEDQMKWLRQAGFRSVRVAFRKFNTALVVAEK